MSTDNGITDDYGDGCLDYFQSWCGNYDTSTFLSNQMCCVCGGGSNYGDCVDTNDGHDNSVGDGCVWYNSNPSDCGNHDTGSFSSTEMCCACGGGETCFDTNNGATDRDGDGCDIYQQNTNWCGNYDTSTFSSNQMCCACGGGRSKRSCVDSNFDKASCQEYVSRPETCGQDDNAYFRANEMCCNCGGGYTWNSTHSDLNWSNRTLPYDTSSGTTDTNGNGCAFYVKYPLQCDLADDHSFTASEQCTSCGGGESRVCQNTDRGATNIFGESCLDLAIHQAHGYTDACVNDFDTVNFSAIEMCCACGGGQTISRGETCHDTEGSALDSLQHTCHHPKYTTLGLHCGEYDDSDFTASEMCCACGGGTQLQCVNTNLDAVDSDNSTCSSYDSGKQCGTSDTSNFNSSEMCCVCGGGERWAPNTASWNSTKTECYDDDTMLLGSSFDTCDGTGRNSCDIVGDPIKCCECQGGLPKSCENTDEQGVTNAIGLSCSDIALHVRYGDNSMCGPDLDTSEFSSDLMCCACAGGIRT
ncbi:hypothetical protein HOH51_04580, partial [bacterium]|nr:hypothetical protein [bacterium]